MEILAFEIPIQTLALAALVAVFAGVVKGLVGFAMPMIFISGLSTIMSPELALAYLIMPTLFSNIVQAFRQGIGAALQSMKKFWLFLIVGFVFLVGSAQLVPLVSPRFLFVLIGVTVVVSSLVLLGQWHPKASFESKALTAIAAAIAGGIGGISGVWGPSTVTYLTAINTPKEEQMRVQGTIYGLGAAVLFLAHLKSGVLRPETLPISLAMVPPAVIGIWIGFQIQDRIDQARFRRLTLIVLIVAGINLLRKGVFA